MEKQEIIQLLDTVKQEVAKMESECSKAKAMSEESVRVLNDKRKREIATLQKALASKNETLEQRKERIKELERELEVTNIRLADKSKLSTELESENEMLSEKLETYEKERKEHASRSKRNRKRVRKMRKRSSKMMHVSEEPEVQKGRAMSKELLNDIKSAMNSFMSLGVLSNSAENRLKNILAQIDAYEETVDENIEISEKDSSELFKDAVQGIKCERSESEDENTNGHEDIIENDTNDDSEAESEKVVSPTIVADNHNTVDRNDAYNAVLEGMNGGI